MDALESCFVLAAAWLGYAGVVYPAVISCVGLLRRVDVRGGDHTPPVSVIIAACNEAPVMKEKLEGTLALDYPADRLEVIVAVDAGCQDDTPAIVAAYGDPRVTLCRPPEGRGKNVSMDAAVARANGEILVFTDATTVFAPSALRRLASNFADPTVGCVGGFLRFGERHRAGPRAFELYKRVEERIRNGSSVLGYVPSVAGAIHALRRELYEPVENHYTRDVIDPAQAVAAGFRAIRDPRATCRESPWISPAEVFRSRARVTARGVAATPYVARRLAGAGGWRALLQFASHKVPRWWAWLAATLLVASSAALAGRSPAHRALFALELAVLALAAVGWLAARRGVHVPVAQTLGFYLMNLVAMAVGSLRAVAGRPVQQWRGRVEGRA
jgi:cellulose synthase/poly-beta-1,6-N-acetylglucosamine synthase-like glycosyltransferase